MLDSESTLGASSGQVSPQRQSALSTEAAGTTRNMLARQLYNFEKSFEIELKLHTFREPLCLLALAPTRSR
jgi:hypothetical protein